MKRRYIWKVFHLLTNQLIQLVLIVHFKLFSCLQDRKIEELKQSLLRYKKVQDMVMSVQGKKGETR